MHIPDSYCHKVTDSLWTVASQTGRESSSQSESISEFYYVSKQKELCRFEHCYVKCAELACSNLCNHLYMCTCPDPSGICKHIHKIHSLQARQIIRPIDDVDFVEVDEPELTLYNPLVVPSVDDPVEDTQKLKMEVQTLFAQAQTAANDDQNQVALPFVKKQLLRILECLNGLSTCKGEELSKILPSVSVKGPQKLQCQPKFKRTTVTKGKNPKHEFKKLGLIEKEKMKTSLLSLKNHQKLPDPVVVKRDPDEFVSTDITSAVLSTASRSVETQSLEDYVRTDSFDSSKSFTPLLGYSNIVQPLIFIHQDITVIMRSLKTLDPYISSSECKSLSYRGRNFVRGWLCESIIDAYLYNLCKFRNDSFFVPCLFMQMLGFGQELKGVFDNVNVFSRELVFFPANPSNAH